MKYSLSYKMKKDDKTIHYKTVVCLYITYISKKH